MFNSIKIFGRVLFKIGDTVWIDRHANTELKVVISHFDSQISCIVYQEKEPEHKWSVLTLRLRPESQFEIDERKNKART